MHFKSFKISAAVLLFEGNALYYSTLTCLLGDDETATWCGTVTALARPCYPRSCCCYFQKYPPLDRPHFLTLKSTLLCPNCASWLMFGGGDFGGFGGYDSMDTGGGFMKSPEKQSAGKFDKKKGGPQTLVPVTIKMIHRAENIEDTHRIDGNVVHTVKIVGTVESAEPHSTHCLYKIDDNTGVIECKQWETKDPSLASKPDRCGPNTSVCVIGIIKAFDNKKHVQIVSIRPIEDFNEKTHHYLDVIFTHLQCTKGPIPGTAVKPELGHTFGTPAHALNGRRDVTPALVIDGQEITAHPNPEVNKIYGHVFKLFQAGVDESGLSKGDMLARMGGNVNMAHFHEAIKSLADHGYLYSTLDENTYACALNL